jgi:hypothetical protein
MNKRNKPLSKLLEEELTSLENQKKSNIQEIDDLDNQKEWVDWISKYGDDISKRFEQPTSDLLEGIVDKIILSPVMGETREGKDTQRGHIFDIKFKLPIVNDGIEYKNDKKKSDGFFRSFYSTTLWYCERLKCYNLLTIHDIISF